MDVETNPSDRGSLYTPEMTRSHTRALLASPWVRPSARADSNGVLGYTRGWSPPGDFPDDPRIPSQPVYGYTITDTVVSRNSKILMIVTAGNHGHEYTGDWILQGLTDFMIEDSDEAASLRRQVLLCIYPNINPEARFMSVKDIHPKHLRIPVKDCAQFKNTHCRGNPELYQAGEDDHNRVWTTRGRFTTVDLLTAAMREDTGNSADYLWDLHGPQQIGNWRSPQGRASWNCPYGQALQVREPDVVTAGLPEASYKPRLGFPPGKLCVWAHSVDGLNIPHTYVYEPGLWNETRLIEAGRNLVLALHDIISNN